MRESFTSGGGLTSASPQKCSSLDEIHSLGFSRSSASGPAFQTSQSSLPKVTYHSSCLTLEVTSVQQSSSPQPFWHHGLILCETVFPWTRVGVWGWGEMVQAVLPAMGSYGEQTALIAHPWLTSCYAAQFLTSTSPWPRGWGPCNIHFLIHLLSAHLSIHPLS